ncbi:Uncharacterized protein OBRU01_19615 [Operophtera brumata]|uniref:ZAD domain-containing protein n=1 Tax=Operophtera brumata TaxID=104452 RepID=A0A0L7KR70_OPEBR|nr:Uncharacterized protein OBRU01_19615 [Operophtera brumata]
MANTMNLCRACLTTKESFTYVLCDNVSADIYCFCTSIEVHENEEMPRTLCNICYELLERYSDFKKTCIQSQHTLIELQNSLKLENNVKDASFNADLDAKDYYTSVKIEDGTNDFHDGKNYVEENTAFTDKDRMALSKGLREHGVSGVMHLRSLNKFKVGITFDLPNNANMFLQNKKLLDQLSLRASIPAGDTEVTGVLTSVPVDMSNKQIFSLIGSSSKVITVRRFMHRMRGDGGAAVQFQPTQAVAVTFALTNLPEHVYLDSWRHEVNVYIPPVKQCLKCMRYGHIAKFCRNSEVCSICTEGHNFRQCNVDPKNAKFLNCHGNHIAISSSCPMKKQKVEENKIKSRTATFSDLFDSKSFPQLTARTLDVQVNNLMKSEVFINILIETITKIISNKDVPINSGSIRETLKKTLSNKFPPSS